MKTSNSALQTSCKVMGKSSLSLVNGLKPSDIISVDTPIAIGGVALSNEGTHCDQIGILADNLVTQH